MKGRCVWASSEGVSDARDELDFSSFGFCSGWLGEAEPFGWRVRHFILGWVGKCMMFVWVCSGRRRTGEELAFVSRFACAIGIYY